MCTLQDANKPKYQPKTGPVDYMVTDDDEVLSSKVSSTYMEII